MTLREEILRNSGVLEEGLFDKIKIKKLEAQRDKLKKQYDVEQDIEKRNELYKQIFALGNQIRQLQSGKVIDSLDDKMKKYQPNVAANGMAAKKHDGVCPQCGKKFSECKCCNEEDDFEEEELDESIGLTLLAGAGIAAVAGIVASLIKDYKLSKWHDAAKKTAFIRLAMDERFQEEKVITLFGFTQGNLCTKIVPTKSMLDKYFSDDKHDFVGFNKELKDILTERYKGLYKVFSDPANKALLKALDKAEAEFYCYSVEFTNDDKKELKKTIDKASNDAGFDKKFKVKIMVEKKK